MSAMFKTTVLALAATAFAAPLEAAQDYKSYSAPSYESQTMSTVYGAKPTYAASSSAPSSAASSYYSSAASSSYYSSAASSSYYSSAASSSYYSSSASTVPTGNPSADDQKKVAELLNTKVTALDREKILFVNDAGEVKPEDELRKQLVFDFSSATPAAGELGGRKATAQVGNFPFLIKSDLSTTVAFVGPCGINTPHVHPRGNEFLTAVNNTLEFGMILENGLVAAGKGTGELTGTLGPFQGTMFPKGAIHYQFNPTCDTTAFVATLSNEDAATNQVAQGFFGLNEEVIEATLGFVEPIDGKFIEDLRSKIPLSLALGVESCLRKCNIKKPGQEGDYKEGMMGGKDGKSY